MFIQKRIPTLLLALTVGILPIGSASAQTTFPDKNLNLVVPFPAGGAGDILARLVATELEPRLGKPLIVQNRPGAGTATAAKEVATSAPDGYTLFSSSNSTFVLPHVLKSKLPYDSANDFDPIAQVADLTLVLITHTGNTIKDVKSLVAEAKANPGKLTLASYGGGTISHFAGEMFKSSSGIEMVHLPYKGSAPAMNASTSSITSIPPSRPSHRSKLARSGLSQSSPASAPPCCRTCQPSRSLATKISRSRRGSHSCCLKVCQLMSAPSSEPPLRT
jgi:tripartite-type tricarboxylate transporter receptor subunit TctC